MSDDKYKYDRFGCDSTRVGQALIDLSAKENEYTATAEEIAEARQPRYIQELEKAALAGFQDKMYEFPFYVVCLTNKDMSLEHFSVRAPRIRFCPRQTEPIPENMYKDFPYFQKDVWKIDKGFTAEYLWTMPSLENVLEISMHPESYDRATVEWTRNITSEKRPYREIVKEN